MRWALKRRLRLRFSKLAPIISSASRRIIPPSINRWKDGFKRHRLKARAGIEHTFDERVETGHHRIEKQQVWVVPRSQLPPLHEAADWSGLKAVVFVQRVRHLWNKTTREVQFYLTSLPADSPKIASAIRQHWGIENGLHWTVDVTFREDECRIRGANAPQNFALLRRIEFSFRRSTRQKSNRAAMDNRYMLSVLAAALSVCDDSPKPQNCQNFNFISFGGCFCYYRFLIIWRAKSHFRLGVFIHQLPKLPRDLSQLLATCANEYPC